MSNLPCNQDLRIIPGVDWFHRFTWSSKVGHEETPIQLDGVVAYGEISQSQGKDAIFIIDPYIEVKPDGIIEINVPGLVTSNMEPMVASYHIDVRFPTQQTFRLTEGTVVIW